MSSQQLNTTSKETVIEDAPWIISSPASAQLERVASQAGLGRVENPEEQEYLLHDIESWKQASQNQLNLVVSGDAELTDIQTLIAETGLTPSILFIDFPLFTDGRGYSLARLLRREAWFTGKLGVIGDVLQDQVYFYWRCGFDIIVPRHDQSIEACQNAINSFSHAYQPAGRDPVKER